MCVCVCVCARTRTCVHSCLTLCNPTEFSRQEYWRGLPLFPTPGDLPDPGIKPVSLSSPVFSWNSFPLSEFPGSSTELLTKAYPSPERKKRWKSREPTCVLHVSLFATSWTAACQASLSLGFSRQEYWTGLPLELSHH